MTGKKSIAVFFIKFAAVILSVSLIMVYINNLYVKGYYYLDTYGEVEKMKEVPYGLQMVNFGTSHGLASFHYPENGLKTYNFALSGEDIYHDFQTLKQFGSHLEKGCIVAIPTSYFSFCMSTVEPSQKRYYCYLDKDKLRGFTYETLISAKYLPVLRSGEFIIKDLIKDQDMDVGAQMMADRESMPEEAPVVPTNTACSGNTSFQTLSTSTQEISSAKTDLAVLQETYGLSNEEKEAKIIYLEGHAAGRVESWRSGYMINGKIYMEENTKILKEMVEYCYQNGYRPVLVTTPIYCALNHNFSTDELADCYFNNVKKVQKETNTPYLNLAFDADLSETPDYYDNSDHLNRYGAAAFFEKYTAFLSDIGYIA